MRYIIFQVQTLFTLVPSELYVFRNKLITFIEIIITATKVKKSENLHRVQLSRQITFERVN